MSCIDSITNVNAGEVCSLEVAEMLGVRGGNKQHYNDDFGNVKTYSCFDEGYNKPYHFCDEQGLPSCLLEKNAGFGFTVNPNDNNTCITSECPPDFVDEGDKCTKPRIEKNVPLSKRIDERWHDWFMIPYYHLGNKYSSDSNNKYEPCPNDTLPNVKTDPVDGMVNNMTEDAINQCISKEDYFEGKYKDSPKYCPLALIMRSGATNSDLEAIYRDLINKLELKQGNTPELEDIRNSIKKYVKDELFQNIDKSGFNEYAGFPESPEIEYACRKIASDTNRLQKAYDICKNIKNKGDAMIQEYQNNGTSKSASIARYNNACQACHTVFSDPKGAVMQLDKKEPLIFENIKHKHKSQNNDSDEKIRPIVNTNTERNFLVWFVSAAILTLISAILIITFWPLIKKIYVFIKDKIITGRTIVSQTTQQQVKNTSDQ